MPFSRVLLGLNIPKVGWVLAQNLARHFGDVDRLMAATQEDVEQVEGFGPDRAELVVEWFEDEQNRAFVQELRDLGLRFEVGEEERPVEGPLTGKTYVITGTLEGFSREEASSRARGTRGEDHRLGLEEDDRADRRGGAGRLEVDEGAAGGRSPSDGGRPARAARVGPNRRRR